jgi:hypothetical protein
MIMSLRPAKHRPQDPVKPGTVSVLIKTLSSLHRKGLWLGIL